MSTTEHVMSKFLNNPDDIVPESLAGLAAAHPGLVRADLENQVVWRSTSSKSPIPTSPTTWCGREI